MDEQIRRSTHRGNALAEEKFIGFLENKLQCVLHDLKSGRLPKGKK